MQTASSQLATMLRAMIAYTPQRLWTVTVRTLQRIIGMFRLPGVVDHRPAPCLGKPHGAILVRHATPVIRLVVPRDLVAVVRRAVVSEELVGRQGASLVQQLNTTRNDAIRLLCAARYLIVALDDARRKRLEIVFMIVLETQSIKTQCSAVGPNVCLW